MGAVDLLWNLGYHNVLHVESGTRVRPGATAVAREGHLYALPGETET
jgi:hypothetical protein